MIAVVVALLAFTASALPASAASLLATTAPSGALDLKKGEKVVASFSPKTEQGQRGAATVRELSVVGHEVIEVRIPVKSGAQGREEVWIAEQTSNGPKVIWWNLAGPIDIDGETSLAVQVSPKGIVEYQTARRISRCDGVEVQLFRRVWDFATHAFRTVGPALPSHAATTVRARRGGAPEGKPLGGFFFNAASSSSGASEASRIRPPSAVNDDDPATAWSTEGAGRGTVLTARSSGGFSVTGLRLRPGDTSSQAHFRASGKPKRLTLIFGHDASQNIDVDLVEDADGGLNRYREPFWIPLPKPVASPCVTVVARDATSDKGSMSIADLDVLTELDGPEAADRLVASLSQGTSCRARIPLLVRVGAPALDKVASAIVKAAPGAGRDCLVAAVDALAAAGSAMTQDAAAALVAAIHRSTGDEEKTILKLLPAMDRAPIDALGALLADGQRSDEDRGRAARVLDAIGKEPARTRLLAAVGHGSRALRKVLRSLVAASKPPVVTAVLDQFRDTAATDSARRADFLSVLGALAAREPASRAAALEVLRNALDGGASFEEKARAIFSLGLIPDPAALDALVSVRSKSQDPVLRSLAIGEIVNASDAAAIPALRAALDDTDPRVREVAAGGLGRKGDKEAAPKLIAGAEQEPWPLVRRSEIAALGELCTPAGNKLLLRAFQRDVEDVRQSALAGIAHCYQARATGTLLRTLGRLAERADMRSLAARLLAERQDPRTIPGLVEILNRLVTESQADISLEAVIADTSMALAAFHTAPAVTALANLMNDPRASLQRIAVDALGVVCDPGPGAAALRAAAKAKDESISIRATAAREHCEDHR